MRSAAVAAAEAMLDARAWLNAGTLLQDKASPGTFELGQRKDPKCGGAEGPVVSVP